MPYKNTCRTYRFSYPVFMIVNHTSNYKKKNITSWSRARTICDRVSFQHSTWYELITWLQRKDTQGRFFLGAGGDEKLASFLGKCYGTAGMVNSITQEQVQPSPQHTAPHLMVGLHMNQQHRHPNLFIYEIKKLNFTNDHHLS